MLCLNLTLVVLLPLTAAFTVLQTPRTTSLRSFRSVPRPIVVRPSWRTVYPVLVSQPANRVSCKRNQPCSTQLAALLEVPDYFFTITFPLLSIFLAFSKNIARSRLEERAWEQRLEDARERQMADDPTLTELELRRSEAAAEWSAYGDDSGEQEREERSSFFGTRRRVAVKERELDELDDDERRRYTMTDEDIDRFEKEFGVEYDPYYDDPYTEDELPEDLKYRVDKVYGDRIYQDGEVFYKDSSTGLYYRQGAQPRTQKFWKL